MGLVETKPIERQAITLVWRRGRYELHHCPVNEVPKSKVEQSALTPEEIDAVILALRNQTVSGRMMGMKAARYIQARVAEAHGISVYQMKARRKSRHIVFARQHYTGLVRTNTNLSWEAIAETMGMSDHTSAKHHFHRYEQLIADGVQFPEVEGLQ